MMATSARLSVSSVYSVDYKKFVCIRVHSWFLMNDLRLGKNGLKRIRRDGQIVGSLERRFDGGRDGFVGDID